MAQKIYTMLGGRSLAFERAALDVMTAHLRTPENMENRYVIEKTVGDILYDRNIDVVTVTEVRSALVEADPRSITIDQVPLAPTDQSDPIDTQPTVKTTNNSTTSEEKAVFLGVCAYIARRFGVSVLRVRIIFIVLFFFGYGVSILLYIIGYAVKSNDKAL